MKIRNNIIIVLLIIFPSVFIFSNSVEINGYKLKIHESNSRFEFSAINESSEHVSVFSAENPRTSSFSIYENNSFYTLGDSLRYRKNFTEKADGGIFTWTSKNFLIIQEFTLTYDGIVQIDISLSNISSEPVTAGLKFLLDTGFEDEDSFYLRQSSESMEINSEYEVENPVELQFWTSGIKNSHGAAIMGMKSPSAPSRIIFGNWSLLNEADYFYTTNPNRDFSNPPYSINDSAVLYLYSPKDILPQNSVKYSIKLRSVKTVENYNHIGFEETPVIENITEIAEEIIDEEEIIPDKIDEETTLEYQKIVSEEPIADIEEIDPSLEIVKKRNGLVYEQLDVINEIQKLLETLSKPGIIIEYNLSSLEELIKKLEELSQNENKQ